MSEPKYQIGEVVIFASEHLARKIGPREIVDRYEDDGDWFYSVDYKNYLHEPMIASLCQPKEAE